MIPSAAIAGCRIRDERPEVAARREATLRRAGSSPRGRALGLGTASALHDWPILTRGELRNAPNALLVGDVPRSLRRVVATGGSSGQPVSLWLDRAISLSEWRYMTAQWQRVGFTHRDWRVVLRGRLLESRQLVEVSRARREVRISTFELNRSTLHRAVEVMTASPPKWLHGYPSSAIALGQLCAEAGIQPPRFKGLLLGSEGLTIGQRSWLEQTFDCRVYTWYGLTEKVVLGGECDESPQYHVFPSYGDAEIVDETGRQIEEPGVPGKLIATGFLNASAPLVRYETGDLAAWARSPCQCSLPGRRLEIVVGRAQDALRTAEGAVVSVAALNLHDSTYEGLVQLQYEQAAEGGPVVVRIVAPFWNQDQQRHLREALEKRLHGIPIDVQSHARIAPAANGKTPLVIRPS